MKPNEIVISKRNGKSESPRRSLNLETISTTELRLLSPLNAERGEAGVKRDAALIAYAHRLRESYRFNENGFRYGMQMLAETVLGGQTLAISCSCRNGEFCHADVVKKAVERVGARMQEIQMLAGRSAEKQIRQEPTPSQSVRTQRAINEILSYSQSDRLLSRIEDTRGRTRPEHSSYLNGLSQFVRSDYERGATARDGIAIIPTDGLEPAKPLAIVTQEHAVSRLTRLIGDEAKAKEIAPKIVEYGEMIAGTSADRQSRLVVFSRIYDALEGRRDFVGEQQHAISAESKAERFERNLAEIAKVAEEMGRLEPSDKLILAADISAGGMSEGTEEHELSATPAHGYERIDVREPAISKLVADLTPHERDRWFGDRFPEIDREIERGTPVRAVLKGFQDIVYQTAKHEPENKHETLNDLEIARAYIQHQLTYPDVRMRHENERYRKYALKLENATTRAEVVEAASAIRIENARVGMAWKEMSAEERNGHPQPLTAREMQFLFTEASPRHYTAEMTATRLSYAHSGSSRDQMVKALISREIKPGPEANRLIQSLESRLERRHLKDSISATRHFLRSLSTPNEHLRYKNEFDHFEIYRKLPPAERDFVYQKAVIQVEYLDRKSIRPVQDRRDEPVHLKAPDAQQPVKRDAHAVRKAVTADLTALLRANPKINLRELTDGTSVILERHVGGRISDVGASSTLNTVSQRLAEKVENGIRAIQEVPIGRSHMLPEETTTLRRQNEPERQNQPARKPSPREYEHSR